MIDVAAVWLATALAGCALSCVIALAWRRKNLPTAAHWHVIAMTAIIVSLAAPVVATFAPRVLLVFYHPARATPIGLPQMSAGLIEALAWIYGAGVLIMLSRLAAGWWQLRRLRAESMPFDGNGGSLPESARFEAVLRTHPRVRTPLTFGWRRPVVLMPGAAVAWPDDRLHAVLRHERAHIGRRDFLWSALAAIYVAAFWPSPFAWHLRRQARLAAELACDQAASRDIGPASYADALVESAREFLAAAPSPGRIAPGAETDLYERLEALLEGDTSSQRATVSRLWTVCAVLFVTAVFAAAATVRVAVVTSPSALHHAGVPFHQHRH